MRDDEAELAVAMSGMWQRPAGVGSGCMGTSARMIAVRGAPERAVGYPPVPSCDAAARRAGIGCGCG